MEHPDKDRPKQHTTTPAKEAERPKSPPLHTLKIDPPVIRESPEFALDRVFTEQDKAALTASLDSGSKRGPQLPAERSPRPRESSQDMDTSSKVRIYIYDLNFILVSLLLKCCW